jgi:hypothetical protein
VLAALPEWRKMYEDETSILFVKQNDFQVTGMHSFGAENSVLRAE